MAVPELGSKQIPRCLNLDSLASRTMRNKCLSHAVSSILLEMSLIHLLPEAWNFAYCPGSLFPLALPSARDQLPTFFQA